MSKKTYEQLEAENKLMRKALEEIAKQSPSNFDVAIADATFYAKEFFCAGALAFEVLQPIVKQEIQYADDRANYWLGEYNRLVETGKSHLKSCKSAWRKAQYWLDKLNRLEGLA